MAKEITNNQLAERFDKLDARFDNLEGRFDNLEGRFDELHDDMESGFAFMKMSFDETFERLNQNDQEHISMKLEQARVGDTCARIERKLDLENAAHCTRLTRL